VKHLAAGGCKELEKEITGHISAILNEIKIKNGI
jgi:hypothetical protein